MAPNDVKTVSVELTAAQAQQVLRTVEKDPDAGNWGEGNKTRNEVTAAFRNALGSSVTQEAVQTEAAQEPASVEEPAQEPEVEAETEAGPQEVPASPSSEVDESGDDAADGQVDDAEASEADRS